MSTNLPPGLAGDLESLPIIDMEWWITVLLSALLCLKTGEGSMHVVLTQTHPAAPYVCKTGNITLRCQYDGVENVLVVLWAIGTGTATANPSTIPGHSVLALTTTYEELVVNSYTNLAAVYHCTPTLSNGTQLQPSNQYIPQYESAKVTLFNLTLASRTNTTLSITWSAGYPKCYSFTVSHSTQDGSINATQPANRDTSHTLISLQPGTTYTIAVEAVRKGDGADGQRAKVMGNFTTESGGVPMHIPVVTTAHVSSGSIIPTERSTSLTPRPSASAVTTDPVSVSPIVGGVVGALAFVIVLAVIAILIAAVFLVCKRKAIPDTSTSKEPIPSSTKSATKDSGDGKQTYAVLDWQNPEQLPVKAPDNEWFTVQYSEVHFAGTK